jgi:hypothetical protein
MVWVERSISMCEYCENNIVDENSFVGGDGVYHDKKTNEYYLIAEHFRNERIKIQIFYCPQCGRELV